MPDSLSAIFSAQLPQKPADDPEYVPELVAVALRAAREANASDIHLLPEPNVLRMSWRIDGVLQHVADFPATLAPRVIARLKVLAQLLTYRTDLPQEGRIRGDEADVETRVSTFPTLFGEKAVVRLFAGCGRFRSLEELGLEPENLASLQERLRETGGVILVAGPAGSGKTTTIYACLRDILDKSRGGRALCSLEDPIEVVVPGVAQSQVNLASGFDMATGLRSLLRQDPEVILVGEIRDRATAETVFQASLSGHLVLTTFHAGSAAEALSRLAEMSIEPYLLKSGLLAVLGQRLLRKLCDCARISRDPADRAHFAVEEVRLPVGCEACAGTGYRGRMLISELLLPEQDAIGSAILAGQDREQLARAAIQSGMTTQRQRALEAIRAGRTSPQEAVRVLGTWRTSHEAEAESGE